MPLQFDPKAFLDTINTPDQELEVQLDQHESILIFKLPGTEITVFTPPKYPPVILGNVIGDAELDFNHIQLYEHICGELFKQAFPNGDWMYIVYIGLSFIEMFQLLSRDGQSTSKLVHEGTVGEYITGLKNTELPSLIFVRNPLLNAPARLAVKAATDPRLNLFLKTAEADPQELNLRVVNSKQLLNTLNVLHYDEREIEDNEQMFTIIMERLNLNNEIES